MRSASRRSTTPRAASSRRRDRRADQRFQRIGENGLAAKAAAAQLTRAEPQFVPERRALRPSPQDFPAHEARPQAAQLAFVGMRVEPVKELRDEAVEHAVAKEFEPLIVPPPALRWVSAASMRPASCAR